MRAFRVSYRLIFLAARWAGYVWSNPRFAPGDFIDWLRTTIRPKSSFARSRPWFTFEAVRWLDKHIVSGMRIFEWGAGASTMFFAARGGHVVSVEHDESWYLSVKQQLHDRPSLHHSLHHVPPVARSKDSSPENGGICSSTHRAFVGLDFSEYANSIRRYPPGHFDIVLIDGRARVCCARAAADWVGIGGVVVLDDSERVEYAAAVSLFSGPSWRVIHCEGPGPNVTWPVFGRTSICIRES